MSVKEKILKLRDYAHTNFIPIVRDNTILKVREILKEENYKNILEIGTAIGYSGLLMLLGDEGRRLTTIEKNEERLSEARKNFQMFSFDKRVRCLQGDAADWLEKLEKSGEKFDFIFLDGPKGQYERYYPIIKALLEENGTLFADNILLGGLIKDEKRVNHKNRTMVRNMKSFLSQLQLDSDFQTQIFEIDDGFSISKLKKTTE